MTETTNNSPTDPDTDCIECYRNFTASEVFIQGLAGLVDQQDVESMIRAQKQILQRFEKTNEMLSNCNTLSVSRLKVASQQFKVYKQMLVDIRKDLDYSCKKINALKNKLVTQYPDSVAAASTFDQVKPSNLDKKDQIVEENLENEKFDERPKSTELSAIKQKVRINVLLQVETISDKLISKKTEISDSNSSESGEADSQIESNSISTSDTA